MRIYIFSILAIGLSLLQQSAAAQCTMQASITTSGPPNVCGASSVALTASYPQGDSWQSRASFPPGGRENAIGFSIGSKGYAGLGYINGTGWQADFWEFDPVTNTWTQKANLPQSMPYGAGFNIGTKGYVGGGNTNDFYEYDPVANTWTVKANTPTPPTGIIRTSPVGIGIGSKGYFGLGDYADFWEYDPATNTWTQKTNYPGSGRRMMTTFSLGSKGYVGVGVDISTGTQGWDFWEYDPATNAWTAKANFANQAGAGLGQTGVGIAVGTKGFGYFPGGVGASNWWEYDPVANTWTARSYNILFSHIWATGFGIGNRGYLGFGTNTFGGGGNGLFEFKPVSSNLWSTSSTATSIVVTSGGTYTVQVSDNVGCSTVLTQTVTFNPSPAVTITGASTVCAGSSLTLTGGGAVTYTWSANAGGGTGTSVIVSPTSDIEYLLTGTSALGCTATASKALEVRLTTPTSILPAAPITACGSTMITLSSAVTSTPDTWTQKANFGGGTNSMLHGFSIGNRGYMGLGGPLATASQLWEYDPATNAWTQKASFPNTVLFHDALVVSTLSKGYVTFYDGMANGQVLWEYNPVSNTWLQKTTCPGVGRATPAGFGIGSKFYMGMGISVMTATTVADFWEYDPATNAWTARANFAGTLRNNGTVGFSINGKGYIGLGQSSSGFQADLWEYDPTLNTWTARANYPGPNNLFGSPAGFRVGNRALVKVYCLSMNNDFWEYDPSANAWTVKANYPISSLGDFAGFGIGDKGYIGTGQSPSTAGNTALFYEYDPGYTTYSWSTGPTTQTMSTTAAITTTYSLTLTSAQGCGYTATKTVSVITTPTLAIAGSGTFCTGGGLVLTGSGGTTYTWSSNAGSATTATVSVSPSSTTSYTLSSGTGTCFASIVKQVEVYTSPTLTILPAGVNFTCVPFIGIPVELSSSATSATWTAKANFGGSGRSEAVGFNIGTKGYMGLGNSFQQDLWEYDPTTNAWTQKANFASNYQHMVGFAIGTKGYVAGYDMMSGTEKFWEFDPVANTWTQKAMFTTNQREDLVALNIGSKGYLGLGRDNQTFTVKDDFWEYDPATNSWTQKTNYPGGMRRQNMIGVGIGSKGYVGLGQDATFTYMGDFWEFDPAVNTWTSKASFPGAAIGGYDRAATFTIGNKAFVKINNFSGNYFFEYNASTNAWTIKPNFFPLTFLSDAAGFSIGGKGYIGTGSFGSSFYEYDPGLDLLWSTSATSQSISANTSSNYTLTGTSVYGCVVSATKNWSVHTLPFVFHIQSGSGVCPGGTVTLQGLGASTYTWTSGITDNVPFTPTASAGYTMTGTDVNGCTGSSTASVTLYSTPSVTANASSTLVCSGKTLSLTGSGASTYTWTGGVSNNVAFSPGVTTTYTVTGFSAQGCTNTAVRMVSVNPTPTVTAVASNTVICLNNTVTLTGGGASTYTWTNGVINGSAFSPTITATYTVTGTAANTCTNSAVRTITVNNLPVVTASTSNSVICSGFTTALNGVGASTYSWTNGVTNSVAFSPTVTTTYTVTGTDLNTCTNTAVQTITVLNLPNVTVNVANPAICIGGTTALSGAGAVTYTWTNGVTDAVPFSPTTTIAYTVTGTGANLCANTVITTVTVHTLPNVTAISTQSVICMNDLVTLNGNGASTYTWTNGVTDGIAFSPTTTLTYTVIGADANTCTNIAVKTITVNNLPIVTASTSNSVICVGFTTTLNGSGATTYSWTNGVTDGTPFSPTTTVTYTVTGIDANACTNTAMQTVTVNNLPNVTANAANPAICIGGTTALSGGGAITYTWTNGVTDGLAFSPVTTITYTVTGTDVNTCENSAVATVTVHALPNVTASASNTFICMNDLVTLTGGGASTYTWTNGATNGIPFSPTTTITYTVTGTDVNTCTNTAVETITVNNLPVVTASTTNSVICIGFSTTLNGSGANTYAWSNGVTDGLAFSPTTTITYTVTGTDLNTCTNTAVQTITVNNLPNVTASAINPVICIGGTTALNGAGATTYTWTNGVTDGLTFSPVTTITYTVTGTDVNTCENTAVATVTVHALPNVTASASNTFICMNDFVTLNGGGASTYTWTNGVSDGVLFSPPTTITYTVTGTDVNTCTNTAIETITVNNLPVVTASASNPVICIGFSTTLTGGGATTYTWTNGVTDGLAFSPTTTITYTVTGTDVNTCTNTAVQTVTVNNLPNVTASAINPVICIGGTTALNGAGATTYTWTNGVTDGVTFSPVTTITYTVTGTDANTCTNTAVETITVNNLPVVTASTTNSVICLGFSTTLNGGGASTYTWTNGVTDGVSFSPTTTITYTVTGTDVNTCTNTAVETVTVNNLPVVTASATSSVICIGFSTTLNGSGATTYTWTNGVTDGLPFSPTTTITYTVTGTDVNTCTNTAVQTVTVNNLPNVTASAANPVICIGGTTALNGAGATTYTWTNGVTDGLAFSPVTTITYTVTGTDINTCTNTAVETITVNNLPVVTASVTNSVICLGFSTTLNGGGASTYIWTNGVTDGVSFSPTTTITYTVTGTDMNTCTNTAAVTVTVNNLPAVTANTTNSVICTGFPTTLNGGGASTYTWTGGVINGIAFSPTLTVTYTVTGTDVNTCTNTAVQTITVNNLPNVTASVVNPVICVGGTTALNGAGAITYTWTNGVTDAVPFSPTNTITYTVTGTDANGCKNTTVSTVTVHALPMVTANNVHPVICYGFSTALSGSGATTYTWTGGVSDGISFSPTLSATYTVTGTDLNTCTNTAVTSVTVNNLPIVTANTTSSVICTGFSITLNGGGASTYTWTGGVTNGSAFSPTITNTYTVTGTDVNGCINTAVKTITVNSLPNVTASAIHPVICIGGTTALNAAGATTYTWSHGVTNAITFSPVNTITYTVTGTDPNTCTNTAVQTITVNILPMVIANANDAFICMNDTVILSGVGANTYTWTGGVINGVAFSPTSTTTYTVIGTDLNGCINTAVKTITVNNLPVVTAVVTDALICEGVAVTFNGGGAQSYAWTGGVINGVPFAPLTTASYSVTGVSSASCVSSNTAVVTVTVNPRPVVTINSGAICIGQSFTFHPGGAISYTLTGSKLVVSPTVTSTYSLTGSSTSGCKSAFPALSTITVNPLPPVTLTALNATLCSGGTTTLSTSGASTYTWNTGSNDAAITITPDVSSTYIVTGTDQNNCVKSSTLVIPVIVTPTITLAASNSQICQGNDITLTSGGADQYAWNTGDKKQSITLAPERTFTYQVTGSNANCTDTKTLAVTVHANPTVNVGPDEEIAAGQVYTFNVKQIGGARFSWSGSEGLSNPSVLNPTFLADHTVTHMLTVTSAAGCTASDEITITVPEEILIANYMSPNGDGKNDTWKVENLYRIRNCSVDIVDGWGTTVFTKANKYDNEFDGYGLPDGVYYYFIKEGTAVKYKGSITLTR